MTESFKQQLQELVDQAAEEKMISLWDERNFRQGCEFLMPVLMKALEQRDDYVGRDYFETDLKPRAIQLLDKELLQLLKVDK